MTATARRAPLAADPGSERDPGPVALAPQRGDIVVLRPTGALDAATIDRVRAAVRAAGGPVVIDLDECVLVDPAALEAVVHDDSRPDRLDPADVSIACGRLSCRTLLSRAGVTRRFAVFARIEDAVQARILWQDGYGSGWTSP